MRDLKSQKGQDSRAAVHWRTMIPFEELERALARWKARSREGVTPQPVPEEYASGAVPDGLPPPSEHTGEIDLNDDVVESVDAPRRN